MKKKDGKRLIVEQFGLAVRNRRLKLRIQQKTMHEALGISRASLVNIEKGRQGVGLELMYTICSMLGLEYTDAFPPIKKGDEIKTIKAVKQDIKSTHDNAKSQEKSTLMKNGKQLLGKDLIFISRINGSGNGTKPVDDDMSYEDDTMFTIISLSAGNETYIASEMCTYVVKIKPYAQLSDTPKYKLWKHMVDEHDLTLLETDLGEIIRLANECKND